MWLGIVLVAVGFLMPVLIGPRWVAPNIELLGEDTAPALVKFFALYPALAGILLIIVAQTGRGLLRPISLLVAGVIPIVLLLADPDVGGMMDKLGDQLSGSAMAQGLVALLGWAGLLAGSRALFYREENRDGLTIAMGGASLTLVALLIPVEMPGTGESIVGIIFPFRLMAQVPLLGLGMLAQMGLTILACGFCFTLLKDREEARTVGHLVFIFLICAPICAIAGMLGQIIYAGGLDREAFAVMLLISVKAVGYFLGLFLLIPVGLADLMVELAGAAPAAEPASDDTAE
jgi:hypothetical protein